MDGLRALAILMVMGQHYMALPWGWTGVDLFFVLSGFLITGILYDTRGEPHRIANFYVRRTLRIFPLYYGVLFLLLAATPLLRWQWSPAWLAWPLYVGNYLRFLHPYIAGSPWQHIADAQLVNSSGGTLIYLGHLWSLCVEEQFYLLWPWFVFFIRSRRALLWICGASVVLVPLLRVVASHHLSQNMLDAEILYRVTSFRFDALLLGGLAALWYRGPQRARMLAAARWIFWGCTAIACIYLACTIQPHVSLHNYSYPAWRLTWGLCFIDLYAAAALLLCLPCGDESTSAVARVLQLPALRWAGRISYGAYIFHDLYHPQLRAFVLNFLRSTDTFHSDLLTFGLAVVITFPLAALSYRLFELPFLNLKDRFTRSS